MKLFKENGYCVGIARTCKKPKFSSHRGRTWDSIDKYIDGELIDFHFDSTWGLNQYFIYNNKWYSIPIIREDLSDGMGYKERLYTKK